MKGPMLNSSNVDGTGAANANPYDIVQNGGKKRRSKQRKTKSRKTKTKSRKTRTKSRKTRTISRKTKKAQSAPGARFIKTAYKYINIY